MLSILAILFLLLGSFTQQTLGNGHGTVTFTIDDSELENKFAVENKKVKLMTVEIKGKNCGEPTIVSPTLRESKQFTVNWKECPGVNGAADLKDVVFHIKCIVSYGEQNIFDVTAALNKHNDEELRQIFAGGKAKIIFSANGMDNEVKYVVEDTNTSASHGNPGPLTFTIDHSKLDKSAELIKVEIKRKGEECGQPTIAPPTLKESKQFTVNWKDCTEVKEAADLKDVEFHIQITITGPSGPIMATPRAGLSRSTDEELKQFYAGGKAKITINTNADNEVKYVVEDTNASHGNPGAFLTFTIDSKLSLPDPEAKIDKVQIYQNGRECKQPTIVSSDLNESKQFSVDHWKECPEEVKDAADLKHIGIVITYRFGPNHGNLMLPRVQLEDCSGYLLNKLLVGGHAKILISEDGRNNEVKYVADKNGDPRNLTFTVDAHYVLPGGSIAKVLDANVHHESGECEIAIVPPNLKESRKFTVDWDSCPKKLNEFTDLDDIRIHVHLSHYKQGDRLALPFALKDYSDGLLRHLFAGGEAKIMINNNTHDGKTHKDIKYVKHPNEIEFSHPGVLTLNVEYENENKKIITPLREVTIEHTAKEMAHCKPEEIKDAKFTVDLAKCKVHNIEDLLNLVIRFKLSVQNPSLPRRNLPKWISVPFKILEDESVQKQFYQGGHAKIVLNDMDKPSLVYSRPNPPDPSAISRLEEELRKHLSALANKFSPTETSHSSSKPGTVKFTIISEINQPNAQFESVEIFQKDDKVYEWKELNEFTFDWSNCPVKPKKAVDLREIDILVTFTYNPSPKRTRPLHYEFILRDEEYKEELLKQLFDGGEAKITINDDGTNKHTALEYVENPNAIGSSSHSSKPGTVKFTVPKGHGQFVSVGIYQKDDKVCETTIVEESNEFTVDWSECEEKLEKAADLKHIEIEVTFANGRRKSRELFFLKNNKDEELEKLFAGGEAKLVINGKHKTVEYVDSPNAIAFNIEYENREGAFFDHVEIKSLTWDVDARCKPLLYEGGKKFSVNLANCGVKTAQDLPYLMFEIRFLLDHAPGKREVKTVTRTASCYGQPAEELEKYFNGGEAKLVFFDPEKEKAKEFFKNENVEKENPFFSLTYLSAPNKPAATSSHENSEKKLWIELYVYPYLWQTEDKKKFIYHDNGHITPGYEELKIINEQNMKLRKDGVECPLRKAKHRRPRGDEFKFEVDLTECSREIKSSQELEGMVLNITYRQGEAAVRELRYQFTKNDPLKQLFNGKLEFRLVEHEHGKVRQESEGYKA